MSSSGRRARRWGARPSRWTSATTWRCSTSTAWSTSAPTRCREHPSHVAAAREAGMRVAFITNNAARPPSEVAEHLRELGVEATERDVVTSAQAAARLLVDRLGEGAQVVVLGGRRAGRGGRARPGLVPVGVRDDAAAVVTGYGPDVRVARHHAGRGADPGRAVVGRLQHRPDDPDGVRRGPRARGAGRDRAPVQRRGAGGGRQAGPAAARRDGAPMRRRAAADGRRPARHRHRGRTRRRPRLAAGDDRGDRADRAGRGRPGLRPTYVSADLGGLATAHAAPEADGDGPDARGLDGPGGRRRAADRGCRQRRRLVARGRGGLVAAPRRGRAAGRARTRWSCRGSVQRHEHRPRRGRAGPRGAGRRRRPRAAARPSGSGPAATGWTR